MKEILKCRPVKALAVKANKVNVGDGSRLARGLQIQESRILGEAPPPFEKFLSISCGIIVHEFRAVLA